MNKQHEELLNRYGWIVECYSPLEIRHTDSNSFATGIAVRMVLDAVNIQDMYPPECCS